MKVDPRFEIDVYGNNAAVRCPSCNKGFIFSEHLNTKNGRICPHCERAKAEIKDGTLTAEPF
jgi:Zn finger protein HypA/HybF involved in hydrogenase expression